MSKVVEMKPKAEKALAEQYQPTAAEQKVIEAFSKRVLGFRLNHIQNATSVASATADMKFRASLS